MRFLSVRELRSRSAEVWKGLDDEREMVVTSNGKPIAILSAVSEDSLEETLAAVRRARAVVAVDELQRRSIEQGTESQRGEVSRWLHCFGSSISTVAWVAPESCLRGSDRLGLERLRALARAVGRGEGDLLSIGGRAAAGGARARSKGSISA